MECYWKTILLLLAVIIQSSSAQPLTSPPTTVTRTTISTTTLKTTVASTLSTSPGKNSTTEATPSTQETATISVSTNTISEQTTVSKPVTSPSVTNSSSVPPSASPYTDNTESTSTSATDETSTSSAEETSSADTTTESTSSTPTTTSSTPTTTSSTPTTTPSTPTTTSSTSTSTNSPSTAAAASTSVGTTPATPSLGILISETNLLLTNDSSRYFVEIQVSKNVHSDSVWLVIQNASTNASEGLLLNHQINISSSINNEPYVYENATVFNDKLMGLDSVLIALYAEKVSPGNLTTEGLHDVLLYSSSGNISPGLKELFANIFSQNLIIDYEILNISVQVSLSRCSEDDIANNVAVLTPESRGRTTVCNLTVRNPLEMKLTMKDIPCPPNSLADFKSALKNYVISDVNEKGQCGLSAYMLTDMDIKPVCISEEKELDVNFTVASAFPDQDTLIMKGYMDFLRQERVKINGEYYNLANCYQDCFHGTTTPPTSTDDHRIRVTVAVVVSCIGVFLLVLLFVVLYLRRKRKGILQFHMTRLDEDDDLVGDMDDFVGNQGATFRNYR